MPVAGRSAGRPRQPVVFVPGLMGSELWLGSEKVWPNVRLLFTQPELFLLPETVHLEPRGIVGEVVLVPKLVEQEQYSRAGDFLEEALGYERGRDLLEFAYDWRQDVRQSAQRLAEAIDAWPVTPPITIIAHSLGTLVSRYYIERLGGKHKVGRVLLIGGPHQGTPRIATDLIQGVGLLPFGLFGDRLLDVIKTFPSVYQILPTYPCAIDQHDQPIDLLADEALAACGTDTAAAPGARVPGRTGHTQQRAGGFGLRLWHGDGHRPASDARRRRSLVEAGFTGQSLAATTASPNTAPSSTAQMSIPCTRAMARSTSTTTSRRASRWN